jgi:hypothetical protein
MNHRVLAVSLRNSNRTFVPHIRFLRFSLFSVGFALPLYTY